MSDCEPFENRFPRLSKHLAREQIAVLPTPLIEHSPSYFGLARNLLVKMDNLTSARYGGNKVRKLEYIFARLRRGGCTRVATFGAAGSNHALATALHAKDAGLDCTCFLVHQTRSRQVAATLNKHLEIGTELVRYGGNYASRISTLRKSLWNRDAWVIPMGGTSWLGTVGFVAAGLEVVEQLEQSGLPVPERCYVACGTMGTSVGIALGLAAAGLDTEVHAVRVSDTSIMNRTALNALAHKTVEMMRRLDADVPENLATDMRLHIRDEYFEPGYAKGTDKTAAAIEFASDNLGLTLETTYTGKAFSALLDDWAGGFNGCACYWHSYNSVPLDVPDDAPLNADEMPVEFLRYF